MKWWREQRSREEPFGIPIIFWWLAYFIAETTIPLVVIAVAMSFIVPVERWVVILAVVAGWPSEWRLLPALIGTWPVKIGVALAWVIGVFAAALLLGAAAVRVIVPASLIAVWAVDKLEDWQEDREADERFRAIDARYYSSRTKSGPDPR